jgi:hypothetical protein
MSRAASPEPIARTTVVVPASVLADVAREARVRGVSLSSMVREILTRHVEAARARHVEPEHASLR